MPPSIAQPGCFLPEPHRIFRRDWGFNAVSADVSSGARFEAMELGPRSQASEIFVFPKAKPVPSPSGLDYPFIYSSRDPFDDAIQLRSGEAYVGPIVGPIILAPRYHDHSALTGRDGISTVAPFTAQASLNADIAKGKHWMELLLWPVAPHWFRRRRPDVVHAAYDSDISGTVAEQLVMRVPAYGRQEFLLAYKVATIASGTYTIRVYGRNHISNLLDSSVATTLLTVAATATAAASANYEYEGKFDYYEVTVQSASVDAGTAHFSIKLRDP